MAVDTSSWDGSRALSACSDASDYREICAGERSVGEPDQRQHWALPHHYLGRGPNADGVRAALQRLPQTQGLTNRDAARNHLERHMAEINPERGRAEPPREIVRTLPGLELAEPADDGSLRTLVGRLAVFDEWAEIDSIYEGHFMERVAAGAFATTIERDRARYRPLFQHGKDPQVGSKVLGPIRALGEDERGAYYEVALLDTAYNRELLPGLKAGLYGSSFRGSVTDEAFDRYARGSAHNPAGLSERTVRAVSLMDFGPVTFPAYLGATASARSLGEFRTPARRRERLLEVT